MGRVKGSKNLPKGEPELTNNGNLREGVKSRGTGPSDYAIPFERLQHRDCGSCGGCLMPGMTICHQCRT